MNISDPSETDRKQEMDIEQFVNQKAAQEVGTFNSNTKTCNVLPVKSEHSKY